MKLCCLCKIKKDPSSFNKKRSTKDGLQKVCRECNSLVSKAYYAANKEKHLVIIKQNSKQYRKRNREYLVDFFKNHPCVDCGLTDIRVLEFDHKQDITKINGIATMAKNGVSIAVLQKEIDKCEVRCKNCHTIKTYERLGGSWHNEYMI